MPLQWIESNFGSGPVLVLGPGLRIEVSYCLSRAVKPWDVHVFGERLPGTYATCAEAQEAGLKEAEILMRAALIQLTETH